MPCLPPGTSDAQIEAIKGQMAVTAYPCVERGGIVWAYMGPVELKPDFPELEWALHWCFGVSAAFCLPGIYLSLMRGRMRSI